MEKCKFCQAELAENGTFCPSCGRNNAEPEMVEETAAPVEEAAAEMPAEEQAPATETPVEEKKTATPGKIALAVAAVVVLIGALIAMIVPGMSQKADVPSEPVATEAVEETAAPATIPADGNPEDVTCKGTYTVSDEEAVATKDAVVATMGDVQLTNSQLRIYYRSSLSSYLNTEYGYYMMMYGMLDPAKSLDTQLTPEGDMTWQQYFLTTALDNWQLTQAMALEARKAGVEMSQEDEAYLEGLRTSLEEMAVTYEVTLEDMLYSDFGAGVAYEDFAAYQELYLMGSPYYEAEEAKLVPGDADLEAYFTAHEEEFASSGITRDSRYVDVRHILIQVEGGTTDENGNTVYSDEDWAACEAEAQAILDQWLAGDKTEDSFAALANEKSEDPGSNTNGGLYENVYMGQMVEPFETWCFDEGRKYGDTGLVKTNYGYHVMYYVGSELMWKSYAESGWTNEQITALLDSIVEGYPVEVTYENITLGDVKMA